VSSERASLAVVFASALIAAGCGDKSSTSQALRTCVDRWNQSNMVGAGPAAANVAFREPVAKERASIELARRRQCIVSLAVFSDGTLTCPLTSSGAYWCPPRHEATGPPLTSKNATVNRRGVLVLDSPWTGTQPTKPLPWQRYPHIDGFVKPWISSGKLRAGLRFKGEERGRCFVVDETVTSGISCLRSNLGRYDACFPERRHWRAGDVAACARLGDTQFVRWTITGH
jgi:hypothetical protein